MRPKPFIIALGIGVFLAVLGLLAIATDVFDWQLVPDSVPSRWR